MTEGTEPPPVPVGKVKCFGPLRLKYTVGAARRALPDGDWLVDVTYLETGATTVYRLSHILNDPDES